MSGDGNNGTAVQDNFKEAMRRLAGTVTIVTVSNGEERHGTTATAVTSLSMDPPSILVCFNKDSRLHAHLAEPVGLRDVRDGGNRCHGDSFGARVRSLLESDYGCRAGRDRVIRRIDTRRRRTGTATRRTTSAGRASATAPRSEAAGRSCRRSRRRRSWDRPSR